MARVFAEPDRSGIRSTIHKYQALDYGPWQRSNQKTKPSTLPPVQPTSNNKKNKRKGFISLQPALLSKSVLSVASQPRSHRELRRGEKLDPGKMQAKIRLLRLVLRNRRTSLQMLQNHENFLTKVNQDLVKTIQDMEDSTALKVREMLQQQNILGNVIDILEYSNKKRLEELKCELQEWEEKEESQINYLEKQVEQLDAKIKKIHEEVNFLSTYMDHEYPVRLVQIANLLRQLQQTRDRQQDELDELGEMRKMVLQSLSNKIQRKEKGLLKSLVMKVLDPHQEVLVQNTRDNQEMLKYMDEFRDFIDQFTEEMPLLRAQVQQLQAQIRDRREIIFEDVLLRRPKCTPEMDVILNIPVEELLPF
ncbi:uncharacterized protein C20orf96 homolog isoform X1 [Elephas maximus indicus]|uniref:uncharacterized protein C20orf96 homolog isoform X1 n=1 Tax=Elephas maximus indicus TaxID=99487 RepID=UPI002115DF3B|nr:uncharacterized protein C20orf96 homolog isoform X1 [Elephas maximus indicus]